MAYPQTITKTIKDFSFVFPASVQEAVAALEKYGDRAVVMAGGTDIVLSLKLRKLTPEYIISLQKVPELDFIRLDEGRLRLGPLTTIAALRRSSIIAEHFAAAHEAAGVFATMLVRNRATVGGNIVRSSPGADMSPALLSLDARVKLAGRDGERWVPLNEFFVSSGENVMGREILTEIELNPGDRPYAMAFQKMTRNAADLSKLNCAVKITADGDRCADIRVALGGIASTPVRAYAVEEALRGQVMSDQLVDRNAGLVLVGANPRSSQRTTADYRRNVSQVLVKRMVKLAWARCQGLA